MSGDNIATINNQSLLDGGNIDIKMNMSIRGTINLTDSTVYSSIFSDMEVNEMRMYLVSDSQGNLPSSTETAITVPYNGILSPTYLYFGKSSSFGVSVGDICVFYKKSALLNVCRILPLNDAKPSNGDFPGADGLSTVWDKNRINKIDGIEWTANHVRDTYLPKSDRNPSRPGWLLNVDECLDNGVYPTCDTASLGLGWQNQYTTVVVQRTSTEDNGGYHTIEQTAYGRGNDKGCIGKRIIFYKSDGTDTQYGSWNVIISGISNNLSSIAFGYKASATGNYSTALGNYASATGNYSTALGNYAKATETGSTALGLDATASGSNSIAIGSEVRATGNDSIAFGDNASATGNDSIALGSFAKASGYNSTALGFYADAGEGYSTALGVSAEASKSASTALGFIVTADGEGSTALGYNVNATGKHSTALGTYNNPHLVDGDDSATSLFTLGKGTYIDGVETRANALEIMKNNDIWFGEYNTGLKVYDGATNTTPFIEKKVGETSKVVLGNGELANIKELGVGTIEIKYEISEEENSNNDIVGLYNIITTMSNTFFDSKQNMWLYNDNIAYNVVIKGWYDNQYNNITYANLTVRLMSNRNGYKLGFNGFIDVDNVSEDSQLCVGYVSGKYNITDDLLTVITPEKKFEISENKLII